MLNVIRAVIRCNFLRSNFYELMGTLPPNGHIHSSQCSKWIVFNGNLYRFFLCFISVVWSWTDQDYVCFHLNRVLCKLQTEYFFKVSIRKSRSDVRHYILIGLLVERLCLLFQKTKPSIHEFYSALDLIWDEQKHQDYNKLLSHQLHTILTEIANDLFNHIFHYTNFRYTI